MTDQTDSPPLQKEDDLIPESFPKELTWSSNDTFKSLKLLYNFVNIESERAINWYYSRKKIKKFWAYFFRITAIFVVAIAGVTPILGEIFEKNNIPGLSPAWAKILLSPGWATVLLATAALCVALDQLGGYSSGWVRYIRTAQKLNILQGNFRFDWEEYCLGKDGVNSNNNGIDPENTKLGIKLCKNFLEAVNSEIQAETNAWAQEFKQAVLELDKQSKAKTTSK